MLTPVSIQQELEVDQQALREHHLYSSDCLAYPYGQYDQRMREITHQYHSCAFTTGAGLNDFRTDPLSYNRPLVLPFGVSWQAEGKDIRSALLAESMLYWVIPPSKEKTVPKAFYHPSRFEGDFVYLRNAP